MKRKELEKELKKFLKYKCQVERVLFLVDKVVDELREEYNKRVRGGVNMHFSIETGFKITWVLLVIVMLLIWFH